MLNILLHNLSVSVAEAPYWLSIDDFIHDFGLGIRHTGQHGRIEYAGADSIDTDSARRIFDACAFRQSQHAVLGRVVSGTLSLADQAAQGRAIVSGHPRLSLQKYGNTTADNRALPTYSNQCC
jgi:hypothetical protein